MEVFLRKTKNMNTSYENIEGIWNTSYENIEGMEVFLGTTKKTDPKKETPPKNALRKERLAASQICTNNACMMGIEDSILHIFEARVHG